MNAFAAAGPSRREFCMILDSAYLSRGVAVHRSLLRNCPSFRLTAVCVDDRSTRILRALELHSLDVMPISELEADQPRLASVKHDRTVAEYCWTAKSALLLHLLDRDGVEEATYVDSDLLFFSDPEPLFEEMGTDSVLITPHRYLPQYDIEYASGTYNAGYMTFRGDERGREVLAWWHQRCLEWCYARHEDGRSGDQKYLDDWTERFRGVHALEHVGGALAPWNLGRYDLSRHGDGVSVDGRPLIFFHFHQARAEIRNDRSGSLRVVPPSAYRIDRASRELVYSPYERALNEAVAEITAVEPGFDAGTVRAPSSRERLRQRRVGIERRLRMSLYAVIVRTKRRLGREV